MSNYSRNLLDALSQADSLYRSNQLGGYFCAILHAAFWTAEKCAAVGSIAGTDERDRFVNYLTMEWPAVSLGRINAEPYRFGGQVCSAPELLWSIFQDSRESRTSVARTQFRFVPPFDEHDVWIDPQPQATELTIPLVRSLARVVKWAPENQDCFPETESASEDVARWVLLRDSRSSEADEYITEWTKRLQRRSKDVEDSVEDHKTGKMARLHQEVSSLEPTECHELAYQLNNLATLCDLYHQGGYTLYKCAVVILRTLLLPSAGRQPLCRQLENPLLPRLLCTNEPASEGHLMLPADTQLGRGVFVRAGASVGTANIAGGAIGAIRVGQLFGDDLLPVDEWLSQPFLEPRQTLGDFIDYVVHKDGGAHYVPNYPAVERFQRCACLHWPLSIRIGETVAEEFQRQQKIKYPEFKYALP